MSRKTLLKLIGLLSVLALVAAGCGGGDDDDGTGKAGGDNIKGGIYRMQTDGFEWNNAFDPTGEYLGFAWMFYSNLMLRALIGYKHVDVSKGGNDPIGDLATDTGQVSEDGLTWTFKIREGVKFSPPVNRAVTSRDVAYALERMATKALNAQYAFYFLPVIEGFKEMYDGKARSITGITTPDDQTIVFKLKRPTGDFRYMLAMPATAPIPPEVGKCLTKAGDYGKFVISSGPYMLEGIDKVDASTCAALKRSKGATGFDATSHLRLVRNPNYDPKTDDPKARSNNIDGVTLTLNTNTDDIFKKIESDQVDGESAAPPPAVLRKYSQSSTLKDRLKAFPGDRTWYLTLNVTEPPFDDVNVRRAANFVMNKAGLLRAWGGPIRGEIAEHIIPPDVMGGLLPKGEFDPYASPDHAGDVEKAKTEMRKSKYDSNRDGLCDHASCKKLVHVTRATPPFTDMVPVIEESFGKIGITLETREVESFYGTAGEPRKKVPLTSGGGWGKDWADASTFIGGLFTTDSILAQGNVNLALVGLTREKAQEVGASFPSGGVPNIDEDYNACLVKGGEGRNQCWADLDKKLMTEIAPWIPYLWATNIDIISKAVVRYEFDQFSGEVSLAHVAIDKSKQR